MLVCHCASYQAAITGEEGREAPASCRPLWFSTMLAAGTGMPRLVARRSALPASLSMPLFVTKQKGMPAACTCRKQKSSFHTSLVGKDYACFQLLLKRQLFLLKSVDAADTLRQQAVLFNTSKIGFLFHALN